MKLRALAIVPFLAGMVCLTTGASAEAAPAADVEWPNHGLSTSEQRFSTLDQINTKTVSRLGLLWSLDLPGEVALEATPIEVNGRIYFTGSYGSVYAVDATTGKLAWKSDEKDFETIPDAGARIFGVNRGVAYHGGKIFYATRDGRMVALDAGTGKATWVTPFLKPEDRAASTGAPRVMGDSLIIGSSGGENNGRGFVTALDSKTGRILWKWYIVPGNPAKGFENKAMEVAAKTWSGEWWKFGGGGHAWNGITYDPEFGQVLIGTGNGSPWACHERADAPDKVNLYLASVVALDIKTGQYKWHYQYNPRECWDWKATADIVIADLTISGNARKVLMHAPSNGFFYVIDRSNGKLISAEKYGKANWADRIDLKTGLPVERSGIRFEDAPATIYPGPQGAHNWQASAYNPDTGLVYIPYMHFGLRWWRDAEQMQLAKDEPGKPRLRIGMSGEMADLDDPATGTSDLVAWNPVSQTAAWRVRHPRMWNGGMMTTKGGLVFQGLLDGEFLAYNAATGQQLWKFDARVGVIAPAITYSIAGTQYVAVLSGPGGDANSGMPGNRAGWKFGMHPRRLLAFALDGKSKLPPTPAPTWDVALVDDPTIQLDPERVRQGEMFFSIACSACHGLDADSAGNGPDLRESRLALDRQNFRKVVIEGMLVPRHMPKFELTDDQLENTWQYIRNQARNALQKSAKPKSSESTPSTE